MALSFDNLGLTFKLFSRFFYSRKAVRSLSTVINSLEPGSYVIDLGGGSGALIEFSYSVRNDLRYVCVDPAQGMLKYVAPYAWRVMARGEELPFKDHAVGAILIGDAIHHFSRPQDGIDEAKRTLKPEGKLFIFDINRRTFMGWLVAFAERILGEPAHFYDPDQLRTILATRGFKVLAVNRAWRYTIEAKSK